MTISKNKILLVGDCHSKYNMLNRLIESKVKTHTIIQLGDLGIGFHPYTDYNFNKYVFKYKKFHFIRGNHDNPKECKKYSNYMGDYGVFKKMFFVSGAYSIDQEYRTENIDWWKREELTYKQCEKVLIKYEEAKPDIVITHSCPYEIISQMKLLPIKSRTNQLFNMMFESHKPKYWIYAHFHISWKRNILGCQFVCLDTMESYETEGTA